jgi:hypothetical protein
MAVETSLPIYAQAFLEEMCESGYVVNIVRLLLTDWCGTWERIDSHRAFRARRVSTLLQYETRHLALCHRDGVMCHFSTSPCSEVKETLMWCAQRMGQQCRTGDRSYTGV